jgi:hypothetical protein
MPKKTTFQVACWRETHYLIEVEATSYDEAENKARAIVDSGSLDKLDQYEEAKMMFISDVGCLDPEWDELSEEETEVI